MKTWDPPPFDFAQRPAVRDVAQRVGCAQWWHGNCIVIAISWDTAPIQLCLYPGTSGTAPTGYIKLPCQLTNCISVFMFLLIEQVHQ